MEPARCLTENSSSPQIKKTRSSPPAGIGGFKSFGLAAILIDSLQDLRHILHLFEQSGGDENWTLLGGGDGQTITGARINFHNFPAQLILLLENQPGKISGVFEFSNNDTIDHDVK